MTKRLPHTTTYYPPHICPWADLAVLLPGRGRLTPPPTACPPPYLHLACSKHSHSGWFTQAGTQNICHWCEQRAAKVDAGRGAGI